MTILVISNPVSGDGKGREFVQENVLPLLQDANIDYQLEETNEAGTAGRLASDFVQKHEFGTHVTIVVSGGDGTIHEVVNGISLPRPVDQTSSDTPYTVHLVVCPQGTANALYSTLFRRSNDEISSINYRLRSLHVFLNGGSRPLTIARTQMLTSDGQIEQTVLGIVVASTALHSAILDSAEHLRSTVPGIDRFSIAAAQNISTWYHGRVLLHPSESNGTIQIFDPKLEAFRPLEGSGVALTGPFEYFLSTVNVDRLEPDFEISPLFVKLPPGSGEMDLLIIRPFRDPSIDCDNSENRAKFVKKASTVLRAAYNHGNHISLGYAHDGTLVSGGEGLPVVEYFRCGGWQWEPDRFDNAAHVVCVDGTILIIGKGGKATCEVSKDASNARFTICA